MKFTPIVHIDLKANACTDLVPLAEQQRMLVAAVEASPEAQKALVDWNRELAAMDLKAAGYGEACDGRR